VPAPIYTPENCQFACPLQWGLTVFWRSASASDEWFRDLASALEPDDIRLLGHRFNSPCISQFTVSTLPHVAPILIVQRVKGRLQHLLRKQFPKAFQGNFALRSFGKVTRETIEEYVASQVDHRPMADPRVDERLRHLQIVNEDIDLSQPQRTSQGLFWHNLHLVFVHRDRWMEVREEKLQAVRQMILRASKAKGYLLSRAGILSDHVHLTVGCPFAESPLKVALGFINNLAYAHGMRDVYQYGAYIGTFGEYDNRAVKSDTQLRS
jgi:REP element-mobilizing transposase RayT